MFLRRLIVSVKGAKFPKVAFRKQLETLAPPKISVGEPIAPGWVFANWSGLDKGRVSDVHKNGSGVFTIRMEFDTDEETLRERSTQSQYTEFIDSGL